MPNSFTELKTKILSRCVLSVSGCLEWQGATDGCGYGEIRYLGKCYKPHRIMANAPKGVCALHRCDNPKCCNPEHLFLGNHAANMIDRSRKCRTNGQKLTVDDVRVIRASDKRVCELAREYGVVHSAISNIKSRRRYMWLED